MGIGAKYFEFVKILQQNKLSKSSKIQTVFHDETRAKHEKTAKEFSHGGAEGTKKQPRNFPGGIAENNAPLLSSACFVSPGLCERRLRLLLAAGFGERGIRTPVPLAQDPVFKTGAFGHSAISPQPTRAI